MIRRLDHFSFTVSDLIDSVKFYENVLGLSLLDTSERDVQFSSRVTGIPGAHLKIAYLKTSNCRIELIQYFSPKGEKIDSATNNVGSSHICFVVDNYEKYVEKLKINKVTFSSTSECVIPSGPNEGKKVCYFIDPDNNTIEIISAIKLKIER
jgi:catechol 2,3-dioxygenase-like lactoylglutathione lyase family enzyme